jgi:ribosomal protein RSM22 (predicted rRNA methylase)
VVIEAESTPIYHEETANHSSLELIHPEPLGVDGSNENPDPGESAAMETERQETEKRYKREISDAALQEHLRLSSYHWRRTIYPPMKGSGHITFDTCTPKGTLIKTYYQRAGF